MEHDEDGYEGPATLVVDATELPVTVTLTGHFEPIDGKYHWYGRVQPNEELTALLDSRKGRAVIRTPHAEADATLSDPDPWGRYRITGTTHPPFPIPTTLAEVEQH
ncbi:DUF4873 domain-containing protein [Actinophytocola gossypii]|uniref:DUF4873 domain-containing protein n=1 Tax=Actinophytocola gossypii TaxID=2812003 RepID=A0ABT2JKD5_9PSEU|nr:DUF4873 domain-containing protein [Actinophytocola gossypii]MCT2588161.1 DUF4873 domain-containing protein [Actinophytocola gossypii]